jgi:transposase
MGLVPHMAMSAIANELDESDSTLWRIFKHYSQYGVKYLIDLKSVKRVCVDETAIKRGHNYLSIFTDYDTGNVIFVTEGRKKEVFEKFYGWLWDKGGHPKNIELFSMDMSKSFKAGQHDYFPNSDVVFDRFHIKKAINEAVDKERKAELQGNDELKKTKFLWLKNKENLTKTQEEKVSDFLQNSILKTVCAYKLKLEFNLIFKLPTDLIENELSNWALRVLNSNLVYMEKFVNTLANNWKGILNAMKSLVSNGVAEGINSKIQVAKSKARGYPSIDNFINMAYFLGNQFTFKYHSF